MTPQNYPLLGAGALALVGGAVVLMPPNYRDDVVGAAFRKIGVSDARPFWKEVLPAGTPESDYPRDWCGAFALWALNQAGLGRELEWVIGLGFLGKLPITQNPLPGDIAYFDTNQHHAVVAEVGMPGDRVGLINGNGGGSPSRVTVSTSPRAAAKNYYSIEPLIAAARAKRTASFIVGGALVAGAAAWALLPSR